MNTEAIDSTAQRRSRISMLVIFGLFAAPVLVAWLLFYLFPDWAPTSTSNHGTLVEPVRPLPAFQLDTLAGEAVDETFFRGKWTFVYLQRGACDERCVQQLYEIRQVRLSQGKNIDRLRRLMLWDAGGVDTVSRDELQTHFPGQTVALIDAAAMPGLVDVFSIGGESPLVAGRIYLVDPLGNLMMSYGVDDEPRGMIKDLHRLLKYSGLG